MLLPNLRKTSGTYTSISVDNGYEENEVGNHQLHANIILNTNDLHRSLSYQHAGLKLGAFQLHLSFTISFAANLEIEYLSYCDSALFVQMLNYM